MLRFIARRLLEMIPVLFIIVTATFFMTRWAPGGPFDKEKATTPEIRKRLEEHYGLNKPLWRQYVDYLGHLAKGDLGPSFKYAGWSVNELIADSFPVSLELGCYALAFALAVGLTAGIIASLRRNSVGDYLPMSLATLGICLPTFLTGPLLILAFAIGLSWYNASGWFFPSDRVLPSITLGFYYTAYIARLARGGMLEILSQDFIRTARAKGASEKRIVFHHALRGGLLSVVSFLGPAITGLVTGSLVVETIFQIPGLGRFFVNAGFSRDYTMVMGTVLFYAILIVVMNLIVDILQVWLNPRLRFDHA
jgi:oligopeptide transport system permease protein